MAGLRGERLHFQTRTLLGLKFLKTFPGVMLPSVRYVGLGGEEPNTVLASGQTSC